MQDSHSGSEVPFKAESRTHLQLQQMQMVI